MNNYDNNHYVLEQFDFNDFKWKSVKSYYSYSSALAWFHAYCDSYPEFKFRVVKVMNERCNNE